jgi:oligopeptide transport system substrate-binding protein
MMNHLSTSVTPDCTSLQIPQEAHILISPSALGEISSGIKRTIETLSQEAIYLLAVGKPVVRCFFTDGKKLIVQTIAERSSGTLKALPDLISLWLAQSSAASIFSLQRISFTIDALQSRPFVFVEIQVHLATEGNDGFYNFHIYPAVLEQLIRKTLLLPKPCQQMLASLAPISNITSTTFRQEVLQWLTRYPLQNPVELFSELQRVLHATDDEFKAIRSSSHLLKLVRSHLYLKSKHQPHSSSSEKQFFYRLFRAKLHVPFGTKNVVCIVISLRSLSPYERFDDRHILLACQRCVPSLEAVPRSFYVYSYSEAPTLSFYMEVEKKDGSSLTNGEMKLLHEELGSELLSSIEQVMSRIDIPQNDEDLLRNLLLLNQQVKTSKDVPHVIVQFHKLTRDSLNFHVTLVRCAKRGSSDISPPLKVPSDISRCLLLRSSILDTLPRNFEKQGLMFLVECSKEKFLRRDRSVDFLKAREVVVHFIESTFGKVRDLNGGIVYQQHQILTSIQPLLTKEESKEISLIEDIFHALSPTFMKDILGPEHILTVFRQLLVLRSDVRQKKRYPFLVEEYAKEVFIGVVCKEAFTKESLFQALQRFHLEETELALSQVVVEGHCFCFVICLSQETKMREHLILWVKEKLKPKRGIKTSRSFRMSLPRPTLVLDPRIAIDRRSGAIIKMLYEGLMRLDPSENPSLAAAKEVYISNNGKRYTFKLRQSYWSNGQPVTAHDFEYAWKKVLAPSFTTHLDFLFYPILNARLVKAGRFLADDLGVHATHDDELVVDLEYPYPQFLELCTLWIFSPLCKDIDSSYPGWAYFGNKNYVCNGPFTLKQISRSGDIKLEKNDRYWDRDRVCLEKIDISIIEDSTKALQLFSQGELDWIGDPLSEVSLIGLRNTDQKIYSRSLSGVHCYMLNVRHPLFKSAKIRHAFSLALNREDLIQNCLYGDERPSHSIISSSLSFLPSDAPLPFDLDKAQALFQEGLAEEGLSRAPLKPLKMKVYNQEPHKSAAKYVADAWEKAFDVSIAIELCPWDDLIDNTSLSSHDILGMIWYSWYQDPAYTLRILSNTRSHFNSTHWSCEAMRAFLDRAETEPLIEARKSLLKEAESLFMDEMSVIPVYECTCRYMKADDVENLYVSPLGNIEFKWATFKKEIPSQRYEKSFSPEATEVRLYLQTEPLSLDPRIGGDRRSQSLLRELFEGLTRIGKDGRVELALAQSVSVSSDGKVYTFRLRPSKWSNGIEVTAEDFAWSWRSILDPSFPATHYYALFDIKNAKAARMKECSLENVGLRVVDSHTLEVELEFPIPYFLEVLTNPIFSPLCKAHAEKSAAWAQQIHPRFVCNGPFLLKERKHRSHILLEKNPLYWNAESIQSHRLSFSIIDTPKMAYDMFQAGELDWYGEPWGNMSLTHVLTLEQQGLLTMKQTGTTFWLNCRVDIPHLQSRKIRAALACAISRQAICDSFLKSWGSPAFSLLPPSMTTLKSSPFEEDPQLAVQLFEEGLQELGYTRQNYPPIIISHWPDPTTKEIIQEIQQQVEHVLGIRVELALSDWKEYMRKLCTGEYQIHGLLWFPWYDDPMYNLRYVKYKNIGLNGTGWERHEYIRLLNLADTAKTSSLREAYLQKAESFVMNELPVIPIFYQTYAYAKSPHLSGEALSAAGTLEIKWLGTM